MMEKPIEKQAFDYFQNGYHCGEAVCRTVMENFGREIGPDIPRAATGFGGGVGRSHEDLCGSLAGGVVALGCLFGRMEPGVDWTECAELVGEFRRRFKEAFGSSNCGVLLKQYGEQEDMMKCKQMTGRTAGIIADLLAERAERKSV